MISTTFNAATDGSWTVWRDDLSHWLATKGLHIVLVVAFAIAAARVIRRVANRSCRGADVDNGDAPVPSEAAKRRQTIASVISSVMIAVLYMTVAMDVVGQLGLPVGSLVAPAAILGAALGFGAQRVVQDLLSGFFLKSITALAISSS